MAGHFLMFFLLYLTCLNCSYEVFLPFYNVFFLFFPHFNKKKLLKKYLLRKTLVIIEASIKKTF